MRHYLLTMKHHLRFLGLTAMALFVGQSLWAYDFVVDGIYYNIKSADDLTVEVTYETTNYRTYSGEVTIPEEVTNDGKVYRVTGIGENAFYDCSGLTKIVLPANLKTIGKASFLRCFNLATVDFPDGITSIGENAFYYCSNITSVKIPAGVTQISSFAFKNCTKLESITFHEGVVKIGRDAFYDCEALTSVSLPKSIFSVDIFAFASCGNLTEIKVDEENPYMWSTDGVLFSKEGNGANLDCFPAGKTGEYVVPEGVIKMKQGAFYGADKITSVLLPEGLTFIDGNVFQGCKSLASVNVPEGVTYIAMYAFEGCKLSSIHLPKSLSSVSIGVFGRNYDLKDITVDEDNPYFCAENGVLYNKNKTKLVCYPTATGTYSIPDYVTSVAMYAFYGCQGLQKMTVPTSVTDLVRDGLYGVSGTIYCEKGVNTENWKEGWNGSRPVQWDCSVVRAMATGCGKVSLAGENYAVQGSDSSLWYLFETMDGTATLTAIPDEGYHFVKWEDDAESAGVRTENVTESKTFNAIFEVNKNHDFAFVNAYGQTLYCKVTGTEPMTVSITYPNDFYIGYPKPSVSLVIPATVTDGENVYAVTGIDNHAFAGCSDLNSVVVPETVVTIGDDAFQGVNKVYYAGAAEGSPWGALAVSATAISSDDFEFQDEAKTIVKKYIGNGGDVIIPEGVVTIGRSAFESKSNVKSVTFPTSLVTLDYGAFWGCYNLRKISLPYGVKNIESYAFYNCQSLEDFDLPESVETISSYAFQLCTKLTKMVIPAGTKKIAGGLFVFSKGMASLSVSPDNPIYDSRENCNAIIETATNTLVVGCKNSVIPESVKSIGKNAFYGTPDLEQVMIPEGVTSIGSYAYGECRKVKSVSIPSSVDSIGTGAFTFITDIESITVAADNPIYDSRNNCNAIIKTASNILLLGCQNTVIPEGIVTIADQAFCGASMLEFSVPEGVTRLESQAFSRCEKMQRISLPESVNFIGNSAFFTCYKLEDIVIPESVTEIKDFAFSSCTSLTEIAVPNKVKRLEGGIFKNCSQLKKVTLGYRLENVNYSAFEKCSSLSALYANSPVPPSVNKKFTDIDLETCVLYVPAAYIDAYREAEVWKEFAHIEVNPNAPEPIFLITYEVDGEVVRVDSVKYGDAINLMEAPSKEGFVFSGWSGYPENLTMPAADIVISGSFSVDGIEHIAGDDAPASVTYDMYGRQVVAPQPGTLYLRGNRKLIAR